MNSISTWIKSNKVLTAVILVLVLAFLGRRGSNPIKGGLTPYSLVGINSVDINNSESRNLKSYVEPNIPQVSPQPDIINRLMVKNATQSLYVENVKKSLEAIGNYATSIGGYVVNKTMSTPEENSYGYITVRVPASKLEEALEYFGKQAVRVVQETTSGTDITDQYMDINERLAILGRTKNIYVEMLDKATNFDQVLRAQQEILNVQNQIDSLKGQVEYMEKSAQTSLIEINLSTDELALDYSPKESWRPKAVFKLAFRSMVLTARKLANSVIWVAAYSVIWVPALIIFVIVKKQLKKKRESKN